MKCEPGCTCSKHDVCRKVGKSNLGRTLTPEHRAKIGRNPSAETRRKISDAQGGPSLCGRKVSYEYKTAVMMTKPDVCDLCNGPQQGQQSLTLDHDHATGELRGWLCTRCNTGLGKLGDDVEGLRRALAYIEGAPSAPLVKAAAMCESSQVASPAGPVTANALRGQASVSTRRCCTHGEGRDSSCGRSDIAYAGQNPSVQFAFLARSIPVIPGAACARGRSTLHRNAREA